jgi:hypothetical protein
MISVETFVVNAYLFNTYVYILYPPWSAMIEWYIAPFHSD